MTGGRRVLVNAPASVEFVESQPSYYEVRPPMWETRPVEFVLDLPADIATSVEEVSHRDPDYLRRVIRYGIARRAVYQSLKQRLDAGEADAEPAPVDSRPTD